MKAKKGRFTLFGDITSMQNYRQDAGGCIKEETNEPQVKSKKQVADHGEVFTAEREVKIMCDLVNDECLRVDSCEDDGFFRAAIAMSRHNSSIIFSHSIC